MPLRLPVVPPSSIVVYEIKKEEKAPEPGTRRDFSESEQILKSHRMYVPRLVNIAVEGTTRVGQHWV